VKAPLELRPRSGADAHNATAIVLIVAALVALGVVLVYSSTSVGVALHKYQDVTRFLRKQILWVVLGLGAFVLARTTPLDTLRRWSPTALLGSVVLLLLVFVPGLAKEAGGANRWISLGGLNGQPSEFAKLGLILFVAGWASTQGERLRTLRGVLPGLAGIGLVVGLIVVEPDMGTALLLSAVCAAMLLVAGVRVRHLLLLGSPCAAVGLLFAITKLDYIWRRVDAFMDPIASASGSGYQTRQAVIALGSGGPFGVGLGAGQQKLLFLPDVHTDFIFALVGEELGFVGALVVVGLFAALAIYGMRAVDRAEDSFGFLLATGIVLLLGAQSILNMAVATNSVPPKGIALPFLSFGGSSMLAACLSAGVLTRIAATGREPEPLLDEVLE
jgi:cell division protein FtsW